MNKSILLFTAILLAGIFACQHPVDKALLNGSWKGAQWLVEGQPGDIDATVAAFTFRPDGTYDYVYNGTPESGTYQLQNDQLFTTPSGGVKMMVKVQKLTQDSLVFNMNRGGQSETLTLLRQ